MLWCSWLSMVNKSRKLPDSWAGRCANKSDQNTWWPLQLLLQSGNRRIQTAETSIYHCHPRIRQGGKEMWTWRSWSLAGIPACINRHVKTGWIFPIHAKLISISPMATDTVRYRSGSWTKICFVTLFQRLPTYNHILRGEMKKKHDSNATWQFLDKTGLLEMIHPVNIILASVTSPLEEKCSFNSSSERFLGRFFTKIRDLQTVRV